MIEIAVPFDVAGMKIKGINKLVPPAEIDGAPINGRFRAQGTVGSMSPHDSASLFIQTGCIAVNARNKNFSFGNIA